MTLRTVAAAYGVEAAFWDGLGRWVEASDDTIRTVLGAIGVDDDDPPDEWSRLVAPYVVRRAYHRTGVALHVPRDARVRVTLFEEDGVERDLAVGDPGESHDGGRLVRRGVWLPEDLPDGYHVLGVEAGGRLGTTQVVAAPYACPTLPDDARLWGLLVQLYAVRSEQSWGIGDYRDLAELARLTALRGGDFLLINPVHATGPRPPIEASPYYPASRRCHDWLALAVDGPSPLDNTAPRIDRDAVATAKLAALEKRWADLGRPTPDASSAVREHAAWCADEEADGSADRVGFHTWVQAECARQLDDAQRAARAAGMAIGVVHDLAVGANPGGSDAWALRADVATGVWLGAPPDAFNPAGQNWQQRPLRPDRLAATGAAVWRDVVRAALRHGGGVRIDHAVGLFRQYWVPDGAAPDQGCYIRMPCDLLLAVLAIEAGRTGGIVIAEDLGTVPDGVPETLRDWGLYTSAVLPFERRDDGWRKHSSDYPTRALTTATTHDLPTTPGFWAGVGAQPDRDELRGVLSGEGFDGGDDDPDAWTRATYDFLAATPSQLVGVALWDLVGDRNAPNTPGVEGDSWCRPLADAAGRPLLLEEAAARISARRR